MTNLQKGIALTILQSILWASSGLLWKYINTDINAWEKLFTRGIGFLLIAYYFFAQAKRKHPEIKLFGYRKNRVLLFLRGFCGSASTLTAAYTLNHIALADSDILEKFNMVILIIMSAIFLKERTTWVHYVVVSVCIPAIALIIKPGFNNPQIDVYWIGLSGAFFSAISYLAIRVVTNRKEEAEHPSVVMMWFAMMLTVVSIPGTIIEFNGFQASSTDYWLLFWSVVVAAIAMVTLTYSYKIAPAKEISVYNYSSLIFNGLLGFVIFGSVPDFWSFIGYAVIVGAGITLFFYNRNLGKKQAATLANGSGSAGAAAEASLK